MHYYEGCEYKGAVICKFLKKSRIFKGCAHIGYGDRYNEQSRKDSVHGVGRNRAGHYKLYDINIDYGIGYKRDDKHNVPGKNLNKNVSLLVLPDKSDYDCRSIEYSVYYYKNRGQIVNCIFKQQYFDYKGQQQYTKLYHPVYD